MLASSMANIRAVKEKVKEATNAIPKGEKVVGRNIFLVTVIVLIAVIVALGALYATQYTPLQASYTSLLGERNALATNYSQLQGQYNILLGQTQSLQVQYDALTSEYQLLQGEHESALAIISLQYSMVLEDQVNYVIPELSTLPLSYTLEYAGYLEVAISSPNPLYFTITNDEYGVETRSPALGYLTEGQIRIPVLPGSNTLIIHNDEPQPILVSYSINYIY